MQGLKDELFDLLQAKGARLMGVADLKGIAGGELTTGVSVAVPVPKEIVRDLQTAPTLAYYEAYHSLNAQLNQIVSAGAALLQERGFHAVANTTDTVKTDENWRSPLPHKTVAVHAGLGWIGKNCLLITERYGGAVRLSSLLTDAPLPPFDAPVEKSRCGGCRVCVERGKGLHRRHLDARHRAGKAVRLEALLPRTAQADEAGHRHRDRPVRPVLCRLPLHPAVSAGRIKRKRAFPMGRALFF